VGAPRAARAGAGVGGAGGGVPYGGPRGAAHCGGGGFARARPCVGRRRVGGRARAALPPMGGKARAAPGAGAGAALPRTPTRVGVRRRGGVRPRGAALPARKPPAGVERVRRVRGGACGLRPWAVVGVPLVPADGCAHCERELAEQLLPVQQAARDGAPAPPAVAAAAMGMQMVPADGCAHGK